MDGLRRATAVTDLHDRRLQEAAARRSSGRYLSSHALGLRAAQAFAYIKPAIVFVRRAPIIKIHIAGALNAGNLVGVLERKHAHVLAAEGLPHQHVGAGDARLGEQGVQLAGNLAGGARRGSPAASGASCWSALAAMHCILGSS